jgi:hypothetical protein
MEALKTLQFIYEMKKERRKKHSAVYLTVCIGLMVSTAPVTVDSAKGRFPNLKLHSVTRTISRTGNIIH